MNCRAKGLIVRAVAILFCTIPVTLTILLYFPLWKEEGSAQTLSGFTLILLLVAALPFFKYIKKLLRSPSVHLLWFIVFIAFLLLSKIAEQMTVISFVGFISNFIGAMLFKLSHKIEKGRQDTL